MFVDTKVKVKKGMVKVFIDSTFSDEMIFEASIEDIQKCSFKFSKSIRKQIDKAIVEYKVKQEMKEQSATKSAKRTRRSSK